MDNSSERDLQNKIDENNALLVKIEKQKAENEFVLKEIHKWESELSKDYQRKEEVAFYLSHVISSPISTIEGLTQLLKIGNHVDESGQELIYNIEKTIIESKKTIRELNMVYNLTSENVLNVEDCMLMDSLMIAKRILSPQLRKAKNVKVQYDFDAAPILSMNKSHLLSIFFQLISNSIKFRSKEIDLVIDIKSRINEQDKIELIFSDNGIGLNKEHIGNKIFNPFKKYFDEKEGKGLGLYFVKCIVELYQGEINYQSKMSDGMKVVIVI